MTRNQKTDATLRVLFGLFLESIKLPAALANQREIEIVAFFPTQIAGCHYLILALAWLKGTKSKTGSSHFQLQECLFAFFGQPILSGRHVQRTPQVKPANLDGHIALRPDHVQLAFDFVCNRYTSPTLKTFGGTARMP